MPQSSFHTICKFQLAEVGNLGQNKRRGSVLGKKRIRRNNRREKSAEHIIVLLEGRRRKRVNVSTALKV